MSINRWKKKGDVHAVTAIEQGTKENNRELFKVILDKQEAVENGEIPQDIHGRGQS
jgi:hypothetical protein